MVSTTDSHDVYELLLFSDLIEIRIRSLWVKDLIAIHDGYKILGIREVDDVMCIARKHDDTLNLVA